MFTAEYFNDIDQLVKRINSFENSFVYRGHASDKWVLTTSLERTVDYDKFLKNPRKFECYFHDIFKSKYHLYDNINLRPTSELSWLATMQHYGMPTRMLDFTESPYTALYFALEAYSPKSKDDIALYAIDYKCIMTKSVNFIKQREPTLNDDLFANHQDRDRVFDEHIIKKDYDILWITEPQILNARIDRQKGTFAVACNYYKTIHEAFANRLYNDCNKYKIVIDMSLYNQLFDLLRKMNIDSKNIYGDLIGLGMSIKMMMAVYLND